MGPGRAGGFCRLASLRVDYRQHPPSGSDGNASDRIALACGAACVYPRRTHGTPGRLRHVIERFMSDNLPHDAHLRCRNRTYISITKVRRVRRRRRRRPQPCPAPPHVPRPAPPPQQACGACVHLAPTPASSRKDQQTRPRERAPPACRARALRCAAARSATRALFCLVGAARRAALPAQVFPYLHPVCLSDWRSKEDLVQAIATSCHIPAWNDGSFLARYRDQVRERSFVLAEKL